MLSLLVFIQVISFTVPINQAIKPQTLHFPFLRTLPLFTFPFTWVCSAQLCPYLRTLSLVFFVMSGLLGESSGYVKAYQMTPNHYRGP